MNMYFIAAQTDDRESYDQFVVAESSGQALELYKDYVTRMYGLDDDNLDISSVFIVPPPSGEARILGWHTTSGIPSMTVSRKGNVENIVQAQKAAHLMGHYSRGSAAQLPALEKGGQGWMARMFLSIEHQKEARISAGVARKLLFELLDRQSAG